MTTSSPEEVEGESKQHVDAAKIAWGMPPEGEPPHQKGRERCTIAHDQAGRPVKIFFKKHHSRSEPLPPMH